jgi:hypothetical protein
MKTRLQEKKKSFWFEVSEIFLGRVLHMPDVWTDFQMPAKQGVKSFPIFYFLLFRMC